MRDLIGFGEIGVEVVFAVEFGERSDGAVQIEGGFDGGFDSGGIGDRESAGQAEADGTDVGIGGIAETISAATEHFGGGVKLDVDFEAYDGLEFRHRS